MRCCLPSGGCCGNARAWLGSQAASGGAGRRPSASGSRSVPISLISCRPQSCHIHTSQAPQSLEHPMLFAFCPDFGAFSDTLLSPLSVTVPSCSWGPTRRIFLLQFPSTGHPLLALGCWLHFLPTVAWARPHHDPKPRLRPCDGPTQDFRVQEASGRRCHHGGQWGGVFGVRLL